MFRFRRERTVRSRFAAIHVFSIVHTDALSPLHGEVVGSDEILAGPRPNARIDAGTKSKLVAYNVTMPMEDRAVSVHPYWQVSEGKMGLFKDLCQRFIAAVGAEPKCLYYAFSFNGDEVFCREAYDSADGVLEHLGNVGPLLKDTMEIARITRLEIHGPDGELSKLKQPLSAFSPTYFTVLYGIRR